MKPRSTLLLVLAVCICNSASGSESDAFSKDATTALSLCFSIQKHYETPLRGMIAGRHIEPGVNLVEIGTGVCEVLVTMSGDLYQLRFTETFHAADFGVADFEALTRSRALDWQVGNPILGHVEGFSPLAKDHSRRTRHSVYSAEWDIPERKVLMLTAVYTESSNQLSVVDEFINRNTGADFTRQFGTATVLTRSR